ncbi:MAG TPA: TonB-dependent receptor, partial [Pyrinomonadaceae bacterium]|nr:TonB-dependent receptor [Pyrinomonadaceae bacterium]
MATAKRQRHLFNFGLFLLFAAIWLAPVLAQQNATGVLQGVVTDENQAIVPEAKIILRDEKGARRETVSGADGSFGFKNLALGKYVLTVEKDGFTAVEREIVLSAPEQNSDLTLAPSAVSESVTIVLDSAEAAVESTLKLPVSIRETPRSISVIGSERIREQNFRQVSDLVTYVPGTTPNSYRNGSYHFYSRGFRMSPDDTRLDGFAGINVGGGGFGASMFGIEEAVVLRGPASLVYGQTTTPGGLINLISKKPRAQRSTRVDVRGGGYGGRGVSLFERPSFGVDIDTTGAFMKNERVLYRALFTLENMNYFTADTLDRNRYANASVAFKLDEEGRYVLTPSVQYTRYRRPYGGGIVISPTTSLRTNDGINSPINENDLSPLDVNLFGGRRIEKTGWAGLDFRGVVSEKIRVNAAYRFVSFDTDINSFTPQVNQNSAAQINQLRNQHTVSRIQAKSLTERRYNNFNADAAYEWLNTGWWKNTTQIGFYERVFDSRATAAQGAIPPAQSPINIYTGQTLSPLVDNFPPIAFGKWGRDIVWNGFVQNR